MSINDEPWFVAVDVLKLLGFTLADDMLRHLKDSEKSLVTLHPFDGEEDEEEVVPFINENGFYTGISLSSHPEIKAIREWVDSVVIPSFHRKRNYLLAED